MPQISKWENPYQKFQREIPSEGEVFADQNREGIYIFKNNRYYAIAPSNRTGAWYSEENMKKVEKELGFSLSNLPKYNINDVDQAIKESSGEQWSTARAQKELGTVITPQQAKSYGAKAGGTRAGTEVQELTGEDWKKKITPQTLGSLGLQAGTPEQQTQLEQIAQQIQNAGGTIQNLMDRIKSEGITDASGNVLMVGTGGGGTGGGTDNRQYIPDPNNPYASIPNPNYGKQLPGGGGEGGGTGGGEMSGDVRQQLIDFGIDPTFIDMLPKWAVPFAGFIANYIKSQQGVGNEVNESNLELFDKALGEAAKDPDIVASYGENLAVASQQFKDTLSYVEGEFTAGQGEIQRQAEEQRLELAEKAAAAGQAYSGFREKARGKLETGVSGIIESSRRALKRNVQQLGTAYESQFGTAALQNAGIPNIGGVGYTPIGGISGTESRAKKSDIWQQAWNDYQISKY